MGAIQQQQGVGQRRFLVALAVVSILGFLGIFSETILLIDINHHVEAIWLIIVGGAFLAEVNYEKLKTLERNGLNKANFTNLTTAILGVIALIAGVFSLPVIRVENPGFLAIKGILSIIAIAAIIVQTWIKK